jgi:hypothetical protein
MGRPQATAALDLLEIAEFAWHDKFDEVGLPKKRCRKSLRAHINSSEL